MRKKKREFLVLIKFGIDFFVYCDNFREIFGIFITKKQESL